MSLTSTNCYHHERTGRHKTQINTGMEDIIDPTTANKKEMHTDKETNTRQRLKEPANQ